MTADFPDWGALTAAGAAAELESRLQAAEAAVAAVEKAEPTCYEELVPRLNDATRPLMEKWGEVAHMLAVCNDADWRQLETDWQPRIVAFSLRVSQSESLCRAAVGIRDRNPPATAVRRRILDRMIQGAELAGVRLTGEKKVRFNEIQARLARLGADFHNAVIDATAVFTYEKDGKTYTIDDAEYPLTMKNCPDREVREKLCRARATRAPENAARIDEILRLRDEEAALLGFADYVDLSLATKCAPDAAAVEKMIDDLDAATVRPAAAEEAELAAFAETAGLPRGAALEPWDRAFCAERLRERKYAYSEEELKRYFEVETVVAGLFKMAQFLFGVEVREVTGADKPSVWHPDVRFFAVAENGETIAHFYFDPFVRNGRKGGGAWMNEFRNRRMLPDGSVLQPLAVVVTNFPKPDENGRSLLPFREVETRFHEFGHALQCMLTRVNDEDAAGISLVEWDAVEVASQFMENWCLDDRTGISVPADLKAKVRAAKNFRSASACRRQLAFSDLDLRLHRRGRTSAPDALKQQEFARFGVPAVDGDAFLCAFGHIFAGGYAAGYYGYKWSEVMSADCYGAFEEAGLSDDAAVRRTGAAYRETLLALGGSASAYEVFRRFRGREPSIDALLRQQGLLQ